MGTTADLDVMDKRKVSYSSLESNPVWSRPLSSHCTDHTIEESYQFLWNIRYLSPTETVSYARRVELSSGYGVPGVFGKVVVSNLLVIRGASNLFGVKCCVWCLHVFCKGKVIMNPAVVLSSCVCAGCVGISGSWHSNLPHLHHQSPWWAKAWTDTNIPIVVSIHCLIIWFWPRSVFIYHMTKHFTDEAFCVSSVII